MRKLTTYDVVTFDLFDTLITRFVDKPDNIIKIVSYIVGEKFSVDHNAFYSQFRKASHLLFKQPKYRYFNLDDIYNKISSFKTFNKQQLSKIKEMQIETELQFVVPRKDILDIYKELVKRHKKIYVISDMYYSSTVLSKLLKKCGYDKIDKIIVSNEYKASKGEGTLWKKFFKTHDRKTCIHIGDNKRGDVIKVHLNRGNAIHLPNSSVLAKKSPFVYKQSNLFAYVMNGLIVNKALFNSSFIKEHNNVTNAFDFGYCILGPIFIHFFNWFCQMNRFNQILFVSREGYFLQQIYKKFVSVNNNYKELPNKYLLTSRRACLVSSIENWNDIVYTCKYLPYKGNASEFFKNRFGIKIKPEDECKFTKANSKAKSIPLAKKYKDEIFAYSKEAKKNYLKYLKQMIGSKPCIVDLGYRGTAQYFLSKILNKNISGAYFIVKKPRHYFENSYVGSCFPLKSSWSKMTPFTALIETFLIAPHGQFQEMKPGNKPVYGKDVIDAKGLKIRLRVLDGIYALFDDLKSLNAFDLPINVNAKEFYKNFYKFYNLCYKGYLSEELNELFTLFDTGLGSNSNKIFNKKYLRRNKK